MKMKNHIITISNRIIVIVMVAFAISCGNNKNKEDEKKNETIDYREEMRDFVIGISDYSKSLSPGFIVIPQNGIELIFNNEDNDSIHAEYMSAIDGLGQEDFHYGYDEDDKSTPQEVIDYLTPMLDTAKQSGKKILITDYCSSPAFMDHSYNVNHEAGYISFAASSRGLNIIPSYPMHPFYENTLDVSSLSDVSNFLYLIDCDTFETKEQFISAVAATNYDLLIIDLFYNDSVAFTAEDINKLKLKANNGERLVICYMSIGEAENYRYYWQSSWDLTKPSWMGKENLDWQGNFKVNYWEQEWQDIIYGNNDSYLKKIIDSDFDGVYLDLIDAFEYFE